MNRAHLPMCPLGKRLWLGLAQRFLKLKSVTQIAGSPCPPGHRWGGMGCLRPGPQSSSAQRVACKTRLPSRHSLHGAHFPRHQLGASGRSPPARTLGKTWSSCALARWAFKVLT